MIPSNQYLQNGKNINLAQYGLTVEHFDHLFGRKQLNRTAFQGIYRKIAQEISSGGYLHGEREFDDPLKEFASYMLTLYPLDEVNHPPQDHNAMVDYIIEETQKIMPESSSNGEEIKPRILFPIRVKRGFRLGLGLNISLIQLMISKGHRVDILWKDEAFTFEENPNKTNELVDKLEGVVTKLIKGAKRRQLFFHKETDVRKKIIGHENHHLYQLRLFSFWDLIERKPPNLGRKDQPWNPGGDRPQAYLVGREIDELLTIHLFHLYQHLGGSESPSVVIQGFDRIIYDLEVQRSLKDKVKEIDDPNEENFGSVLDDSLPKMIYMPPFPHIYQTITPAMTHHEMFGDKNESIKDFGDKVGDYLDGLKESEVQIFHNLMESYLNSRSGSITEDGKQKSLSWMRERCKVAIVEMGQQFKSSTEFNHGDSQILEELFVEPKDVIEILKFLTVKGGAEKRLEKQLKYMLTNFIAQKDGPWYYSRTEARWVTYLPEGGGLPKPNPYYKIQGDNNEKNAWSRNRVEEFNKLIASDEHKNADGIPKELFVGGNSFFRVAMKTEKGPMLISPIKNVLRFELNFEKMVNYLGGESKTKKN